MSNCCSTGCANTHSEKKRRTAHRIVWASLPFWLPRIPECNYDSMAKSDGLCLMSPPSIAWVITCLSQSIAMNKPIHACKRTLA